MFDIGDFTQQFCDSTYTLSCDGSSHRPSGGNHSNNTGGYPIDNNPSDPHTIPLVDINGKTLKTISIENTNAQISLSGFAKGVYLLKLTDSDNHVMAVRKIVKQ